MCTALRDMGNPFRDESDQLVTIDTKDVMDASVVETLRKVATIGKQQYQHLLKKSCTQILQNVCLIQFQRIKFDYLEHTQQKT